MSDGVSGCVIGENGIEKVISVSFSGQLGGKKYKGRMKMSDNILMFSKIIAGGWTQKRVMDKGIERKVIYDKDKLRIEVQGIGGFDLPQNEAELDNQVANGDYVLGRLQLQFCESVKKLIEKTKAKAEAREIEEGV